MKKIILNFLIAFMLVSNVSAGNDGENNLSKKNRRKAQEPGERPGEKREKRGEKRRRIFLARGKAHRRCFFSTIRWRNGFRKHWNKK